MSLPKDTPVKIMNESHFTLLSIRAESSTANHAVEALRKLRIVGIVDVHS